MGYGGCFAGLGRNSQAVDPSSFLRTMKDLDGNPIDVSVQQDAQGFLLDLFDKLEVLLFMQYFIMCF